MGDLVWPCRGEMPSLDHLQARYGGDGLQVIPLSVDRGEPGQIETFYEETGVQHLKIYRDPSGRGKPGARRFRSADHAW